MKLVRPERVFVSSKKNAKMKPFCGWFLSPYLSIYEMEGKPGEKEVKKFLNGKGKYRIKFGKSIEMIKKMQDVKPMITESFALTPSIISRPFLLSPQEMSHHFGIEVSERYKKEFSAILWRFLSISSYLMREESLFHPFPVGRCEICGERMKNKLTVHHLHPRRYGGRDIYTNRVTLCEECHNRRFGIETIIAKLERVAKNLVEMDFHLLFINLRLLLLLFSEVGEKESLELIKQINYMNYHFVKNYTKLEKLKMA